MNRLRASSVSKRVPFGVRFLPIAEERRMIRLIAVVMVCLSVLAGDLSAERWLIESAPVPSRPMKSGRCARIRRT